jgi:uncharacterized C2H2 Zn-finger protein
METPGKFECGACGAKFTSERELKEHGKAHAGMQTDDHSGHEHFTCNVCGSAFHSEAELKEHGKRFHM